MIWNMDKSKLIDADRSSSSSSGEISELLFELKAIRFHIMISMNASVDTTRAMAWIGGEEPFQNENDLGAVVARGAVFSWGSSPKNLFLEIHPKPKPKFCRESFANRRRRPWQ